MHLSEPTFSTAEIQEAMFAIDLGDFGKAARTGVTDEDGQKFERAAIWTHLLHNLANIAQQKERMKAEG